MAYRDSQNNENTFSIITFGLHRMTAPKYIKSMFNPAIFYKKLESLQQYIWYIFWPQQPSGNDNFPMIYTDV